MKNATELRLLYVADGVSTGSKVGDIVHVREVCKALSKKGFKITLLIRGKSDHKADRIKNMFSFKIPFFKFPLSFLSYISSLFSIAMLTIVTKPSVIYVRDTGINLGVLSGKLLRVPVVLELNGDLTKEYSRLPFPLDSILSYFMRFSYSSADRAIVPAQNMALLLESQGAKTKNIFCIPNGVDADTFYPMNKNMSRQKIGLQESFYFCFVGHLAAWQGVDNAIIAFSELLKIEEPQKNLNLLVVGDGPLKKKLEHLALRLKIENHIIFLGSISHELIPYVICASDVCIAPFVSWRNKKIGISPLKLYEYLCCGRPVVISSIPGTEIVEQLGAGVIVPPDNIVALTNAFQVILKNIPYYEKNESDLHKKIEQLYSWNVRVSSLAKVILDLVNEC